MSKHTYVDKINPPKKKHVLTVSVLFSYFCFLINKKSFVSRKKKKISIFAFLLFDSLDREKDREARCFQRFTTDSFADSGFSANRSISTTLISAFYSSQLLSSILDFLFMFLLWIFGIISFFFPVNRALYLEPLFCIFGFSTNLISPVEIWLKSKRIQFLDVLCFGAQFSLDSEKEKKNHLFMQIWSICCCCCCCLYRPSLNTNERSCGCRWRHANMTKWDSGD